MNKEKIKPKKSSGTIKPKVRLNKFDKTTIN